jgi:hypothetical protein
MKTGVLNKIDTCNSIQNFQFSVKKKISRVWWCMTINLATWEAEVGRSLLEATFGKVNAVLPIIACTFSSTKLEIRAK